MKSVRSLSALVFLFLNVVFLSGLNNAALAQKAASPGNEAELAKAMDAAAAPLYKADGPGAAVLVMKDGKPIFRKGYGMADIALGIPMRPEMVFRLGSVTKQFTAAGILLLEEEGKLSISDEITKYLPDYPTQGKKITIEHLLTHTSGIKNYTNLPKWLPLWGKDLSLTELIDLFKNEPLDFEPGTKWNYSNSGYILLGAIIEKASGQKYDTFVETRIFKPLGMTHSFYGHNHRIIPNHVAGYDKTAAGYSNAAYLSMTHPHAAGALVSSVDDLALWDAALNGGKLLKPESLKKMFTPFKLADGKLTNYALGWGVGAQVQQHSIQEHGGGINGFATDVLRMPQDHVYVVVLTNCTDPETRPEALAHKLAAIAIGKPLVERTAIKLDPKVLDAYTGVYQVDETTSRMVTRENDHLLSQRTGGSRLPIFPFSETEFFVKNSGTEMRFIKDGTGKVTGMEVTQEDGTKSIAARTDKPLPKARQSVQLDPKVFDAYVGEYELAPNFILTISRADNKFLAQATGQTQLEILPESETEFFLTAVDAQLTFVKNDEGKVTQLILHQGGRDVPGKKIK
ncbi:MAG: serine hydrolase [Blastocatellia bacterium]|nr:serine hydrolase [Blastocatellia bacterium]